MPALKIALPWNLANLVSEMATNQEVKLCQNPGHMVVLFTVHSAKNVPQILRHVFKREREKATKQTPPQLSFQIEN